MRIPAILFALSFSFPALAHEFWIEPSDYLIDADGIVQAELVNGQEFAGSKLAYLPQRFSRFYAVHDRQGIDVENRIGARPALDMAPMGDGLHIFGYQSRMSTLRYTEWEKFLKFADHKDFGDVEAMHAARGIGLTDFSEGYWRFAKSLVGVGSAEGEDLRTGLAIEFVALDNPYTADPANGIRVQLYFEAGVRPDAQVELFDKAPDGTVTITLHRTDANGIATLPVTAGHEYLVDSVVLREPSPQLAERAEIVWETIWASLTFAVPE